MWSRVVFCIGLVLLLFVEILISMEVKAAVPGTEQEPDYRAVSFVPTKSLQGSLADLRIDVTFPDSSQGRKSKDAMSQALQGRSFQREKTGDWKSYARKCEIQLREWVLNEGPQESERGITFTVFCGRPDTEERSWSPTFDTSEAVMAYISQFPFPPQ